MKKFLSLLLAMMLMLSLIACNHVKSGDDDDDDDRSISKSDVIGPAKSSETSLFDYVKANGDKDENDYYLGDVYTTDEATYSFFFIADDEEKELKLYCSIKSDDGTETSCLIEEEKGEKTFSAFVSTEVSGTEYSAIGYINPTTFSGQPTDISNFYTEASSTFEEPLTGLLATSSKLTLTCAKIFLEDTPFSIEDLGFKNLD